MKELWLDIPDVGKYQGYYEVSNLSRVRRKDHTRECRNQHGVYQQHYPELYMNQCNDKDGYLLVTIGSKYTKRVHRLIGMFIPNDDPVNKTQINHLNGIKDDNRICNLEWSTPGNNYQHAFDTELNLGPLGELNGNSKLHKEDVIAIKELLENSESTQKDIAIQFGISAGTVSGIKLGRAWSHVTKYPYKGRNKKHQGEIR